MNTKFIGKMAVAIAFLLPAVLIMVSVSRIRNIQRAKEQVFQKRAEAAFERWESEHRDRMIPISGLNSGALTNLSTTLKLTAAQKDGLVTAVMDFYHCYGVGTFEAFRAFRLSTPYELDTNSLANLQFCLPKGVELPEEPLQQLAVFWKHFVGTNRLLKVSPGSIKITIGSITDKHQGIYSKATNYVAEAAIGYLPRVVIVHPTAKEIFQRDGKVIHATVEQFVMTSANPDSVDPLFVSFYWVDELGQWLPYEIARLTGDFRTIL